MAKNFPYFKFIATEWLTGDIMFEDYELQGIFINICALYWHRDGEINVEELTKRLKTNRILALKERFLNIDDKGFISIKFLDEQLVEANHISKVNSENGKKGANAKRNKATAKRPLSETKQIKEEQEEEEEQKQEPKEDFVSSEFLEVYNTWMKYKTERKESYKSSSSKKVFYDSLVKMSDNNPIIASQIINQSIANNWAGIFKLKSETKKPINNVSIPIKGTIANNTFNS